MIRWPHGQNAKADKTAKVQGIVEDDQDDHFLTHHPDILSYRCPDWLPEPVSPTAIEKELTQGGTNPASHVNN